RGARQSHEPADTDAMITAERARELLDYDPATGIMCWKVSRGGTRAGDRAVCKDANGYLTVRVERKLYYVHRLAWLMCSGHWPDHQIDHENTVKSDNRLDNLRDATNQQNHGNIGLYANNTSGAKGVSWDSCRKCWEAYIAIAGKKKHLGRFQDKYEAAQAYIAAARGHFGEFARAA